MTTLPKLSVVEQELLNEIMATDIFIKVADAAHSKPEISSDIKAVFNMLRAFEQRFSRFLTDNELDSFNNSSGELITSDMLFELLEIAVVYFKKTDGTFDISLLDALRNEGYQISKNKGFIDTAFVPHIDEMSDLSSLKLLDRNKKLIYKPKSLKIDLGGIGKGYIAGKASDLLDKKYKNFIINVGGDLFASGCNIEDGYDYWAIAVENPQNPEGDDVAVLLVSDKAVATSGVNKRKWELKGEQKNHLIDPKSNKSVANDLLAVTVVSDSCVDADILAKSLLIMGLEAAHEFCKMNNVAALIIDKSLRVFKTKEVENYVYKEV